MRDPGSCRPAASTGSTSPCSSPRRTARGGAAASAARTSWYPASCVKLGYAIAAVHWCEAAGRAGRLPRRARRADAAGFRQRRDRVSSSTRSPARRTGRPRARTTTPSSRAGLYTENLLAGARPAGRPEVHQQDLPDEFRRGAGRARGARARALRPERDARGRRREPHARARLRRVRRRGRRIHPLAPRPPARLGARSLGGGFPEGTAYESKIGDAYDTLAEIVHATLPDGRRVIIAAFSNGRDPDGPDEQDITGLAPFAKLLLERLPTPDD